MGAAPKTRVTRLGKKTLRVKQDGKREFITALEAVSADGFPFPSYPIGKGGTHIFDWYKNVDKEVCWAVSHSKNAELYHSTLARFLVNSYYLELQVGPQRETTQALMDPLKNTSYTKCEL